MTTLHYAAGGTFDANDNFGPVSAGFNLADVQSVDQVNALPNGVQAMVWLGSPGGATQDFKDEINQFIGNPKVYGFYLADEPDPTGKYGPLVTAADLKAESDYIHANDPGAKTYITLMDMGYSANPSYANTYNPQNTGIDLYGIDAYPVRSETSTVDYNMIDTHVAAAEATGIPQSQLVPIYQAFGGGAWVDDAGGKHVMPTAAQEQQIINEWAKVLPNPAFDYAYAWGSQEGDTALENSPALQAVFQAHNASSGTAPSTPPTGTGTPTDGSDPSTGGTGGTSGGTDPSSGSDPSSGGTTASGSGHTGHHGNANSGSGHTGHNGNASSGSGHTGHNGNADSGSGHTGHNGNADSGSGHTGHNGSATGAAHGHGQDHGQAASASVDPVTTGSAGQTASTSPAEDSGVTSPQSGDSASGSRGSAWHLTASHADDASTLPVAALGDAIQATHGIDLASITDAAQSLAAHHWHW